MKQPTACRQCRESKRKCIRRGAGNACVTCLKRRVQCDASLRKYSALQSSLLPKQPSTHDDTLHPSQSKPTLDLSTEVAQELVEHYLIKIHDRPHSLFHPPTLRDEVRRGSINRALLLSICSMGCRFSSDAHIQSLELSMVQESKRLLQADLENICLENIQTCILIANLCAGHFNPSSEALYFRIANGMAEILGLNSTSFVGSIVMLEVRRRVWWTLFMADRWCSSGIGLPRQIKELGGTVDLPMDETIFQSLSLDQENLATSWKPGLWAHMISLVQHFGPIQDLNRRSAQGGVDDDELDGEVAYIARQLELWEKMLPSDSKMTDENFHLHQDKGTGGAFVALHLGYHHYSTLLYFRFLEDQRSSTDLRKNCASLCKHHASAYSALLRRARETTRCEAVYPTVGHMAVVSSSVLLHTLLFGHEDEIQTARHKLNANFEALLELKQYWPSMESMIQRLVTFQNICLLSVEHSSHRLDGWMVRFLIEHSLPLEARGFQAVPSGIEMEPDSLSLMAQEFTEQGRYTDFGFPTLQDWETGVV
ncbi:hypothetical protein NM208_g7808 [Fusarium decemcellulare]|uniref:Uncharacterized protein n=1 Tax=Fusarium decemcellulare TaxID=57161 RepID=A0ACC1S886_9HYPO|nr:hypothetical protein NM208_g7808 [Fusarium decemcellulare]